MIVPTTKRDQLVEIEQELQIQWETEERYKRRPDDRPKYLITFPYPYMNGTLHLGHAYTISKAEFMARYKELRGYNVLFPFGFHGTGMPIVACAEKLAEALKTTELYGNDRGIERLDEQNQIKILLKMGIPKGEILKLVEPYNWLRYFPKRAKEDVRRLGVSADLSRSFITTDMNKYYDSFVKWQFNRLNEKGLLKFGKKHVIYSPKDGQVCADHDRSLGEGVMMKEYIVMKMKLSRNEYILVATTRPETFYRMTNVWVNENEEYVRYTYKRKHYICREEMMRNIKYQGIKIKKEGITRMRGIELIGRYVTPPKTFDVGERMYRKAEIVHGRVDVRRGSGIVGSVPSHCAADYYDYVEYQKNKDQISLYGVIEINGDINHAVKLLKQNKTKKQVLEMGKKIFREEEQRGIMAIGKYKGQRSFEARALIKRDIIEKKEGFIYYEPESEVISRSGDRCVVALVDQWFIDYGNEELTVKVTEYIENSISTYNMPEVRNQLKTSSEWIDQWPCSRSYGLGTRLLDTQYTIDSLSDSTIYMAYYTIAHIIERIPHDMVNEEVWNYIYMEGEMTEQLASYEELLISMKKEFKYWYPMDVRVSGKDLVPNHLTMCLYNHMAIWGEEMMPKSYAVNGHIFLNGRKMSKSEGNFMTLNEALKRYGADSLRIALAEAGSGIEDANFTDRNADAAVLRLSAELEWFKEMINMLHCLEESKEELYWDKVFKNETLWRVTRCIEHYEAMEYQKVLVEGFYEMMNARDSYRLKCEQGLINMNKTILITYMEWFVTLLYPIAPHWSTTVWEYARAQDYPLNRGEFKGGLGESINKRILFINANINRTINKCRTAYHKAQKRKKSLNEIEITTYEKLSPKSKEILEIVKELLTSNAEWSEIMQVILSRTDNKKLKNTYASFVKMIENNVKEYGNESIEWMYGIDELEYKILEDWMPSLLESMNMIVTIIKVEMMGDKGKPLESKVVIK